MCYTSLADIVDDYEAVNKTKENIPLTTKAMPEKYYSRLKRLSLSGTLSFLQYVLEG